PVRGIVCCIWPMGCIIFGICERGMSLPLPAPDAGVRWRSDMNNEETAIALVRQVFSAFNSGNITLLADSFHREACAEFPFAPPGMPPIYEGHDAVMAAFAGGRASIAE